MEIGGLIGLSFGIIMGLIGLIMGRKKAKKRRELDEFHHHIWEKTRSISWYVTLVVIYILLILALLGFITSLIKSLSILLVVHLFTWAIIGSYLSSRLYAGAKADRQLRYFSLVYFIVLGLIFIIVTIFFL